MPDPLRRAGTTWAVPKSTAVIPDDRLLIDRRSAAHRLAIGIRTLDALVAGGLLPIVRIKRRRLFAVSDLAAFVDRQRRAVASTDRVPDMPEKEASR